MRRRKLSPDPREAQRQRLEAAAARLLSSGEESALVLAWNSLLMAWEAAVTLRALAGEFWVDGAAVREFLAAMRSLLRNGLPREVAEELGREDADRR